MMLSLEVADAIVNDALVVGRKNNMNPLTIVVLDAGGHIIVLKREDGSGIMRPELAIAKAYGALGLGMSSRELMDSYVNKPNFHTAMSAVSSGRYAPMPGGVLIKRDGAILGAVAVTGDSSDRDELCAILGVHAAGLESDPKEPSVKGVEENTVL